VPSPAVTRPRGVRGVAVLCAGAALLIGPVVVAFFAGGFFDGPRDVALLVAAVVLLVLVLAGEAPLPRHRAARVAVAAAIAFAGWTALSMTWAPVRDFAGDDAQRVLLYAVVLTAAAAAFRERAAARAVEPFAAAGALVVVGYGLAGRLLPGLVVQHPQRTALGRLDQPLTYWNAMGALAALGLVLCARLAGDSSRPFAVRAAGAASAVPLGMGAYLSFSRGALAALGAGLIALVLLAPARAQLRAVLVALAAGAGGALSAAASGGVRAYEGTLSAREREGAIVLAVVVVLMALAAAATRLSGADRPVALPRGVRWAGWATVLALLVLPILVAGGRQPTPVTTGASNERFARLGSQRYAYWNVALDAGLRHPLRGVGASGFRVVWLEHRHSDETVRDAHSLEIETFTELGLVGLVIVGALLGGVGLAAAAVHRADPQLAAGPAAALVVWALHSSIDWDWEMPGLTLVAVVLAGTLLARAGAPATTPRQRPAQRVASSSLRHPSRARATRA
jgi:O-Antigen ligase